MTPISFASSYGWYHEAKGRCGLVLCAPQGHEDLCTHKSFRLMADAFAAQGYPTLRFDYGGTGDSLGHDRDADRVEAWIASIKAAVTWLRANSHAEKIVLVGMRLGGALAALAAQRLNTIAGLILFAPVVTGRAYMRELSALSNLIRKPEGSEKQGLAADLEIAGFLFTPETVRDIGAIDLTALRVAPAPEALIVAVESQASASRLAAQWSKLGARVERQNFTHYAELMADAAFARYPAEAVQHALDWLAARFDPMPSRVARHLPDYAPLEEETFSEHPIFFGPAGRLFGILCVPKDLDYERPVVIYLNAGANHHIGWGRATVEGCRKLAAAGIVSLRIDIAAIGDSADPNMAVDQILYREDSIEDVVAALDWLEMQGFHNVTVIGLCAGAHLAFHTALADSRVSRIVLLNLQRFVWRKGDSLAIAYREAYQSTGFYLRRLFLVSTWRRLAQGEIKALGIMRTLAERAWKKLGAFVSSVAGLFGHETNGETARVKAWMKKLDARGVSQTYVFSVGDAGFDELSLYRRISGGRVKHAPQVHLAFIENADHNLSQHAARDVFLAILEQELFPERGEMSRPESAARPLSAHGSINEKCAAH